MEPAPSLPREVRDLAARLGAEPAARSVVSLVQRGVMRAGPASRWMRFRARQRIELQRPEFAWRATTGPLGCIAVTDALRDGEADLAVRAFGLLRIAGVRGGLAAKKGERMRYLAELAWAPDAILHNPSLDWRVGDDRTLFVSTGQGEARGEVELQLDEAGRIGAVCAEDRPRKEAQGFVPRPWRGRFSDYRLHCGRWLPFAGEVGWVLDGQLVIVWRGQLLDWTCT